MKSINKISYLLLASIVTLALFSCSDNDQPDSGKDDSKDNVYLVENGEAIVILLAEKEDVVIPSQITIEGTKYSVTSIANNACNNKIRKLHLPSSIKEIAEDAFKINNLEEVYIEDLVSWCDIDFKYTDGWYQSIGSYYSSNANPLRNNVKFYINGELIEDLVIPESVSSLKPFVFAGLKTNSITFPDHMQSIGTCCFQNSEMPELKIPDFINEVGLQAFSYSIINTLHTGNGVKKIDGKAFMNCDLSEVYFGENVEKVDELAFSKITTPLTLHLSRAIEFAGGYSSNTFFNSDLYCIDGPNIETLLNSGFLDNGTNAYHYSLSINGEKLTSLEIPTTTSPINISTLFGIEEISFEEGVTSVAALIGMKDLKTVYFPSTLNEIGMFTLCPELTDIYCNAIIPPKIKNAISDCNENNCLIHVPSESVDTYKNNSSWKVFNNIVGE